MAVAAATAVAAVDSTSEEWECVHVVVAASRNNRRFVVAADIVPVAIVQMDSTASRPAGSLHS